MVNKNKVKGTSWERQLVDLLEEKLDNGAKEALEAIGVKRPIHQFPSKVLWQGQKRRVALARLWLSPRPLWLLDEPFTSLDAASTNVVTKRLLAHLQRGGLAVLVTHQEIALPTEMVHRLGLTG